MTIAESWHDLEADLLGEEPDYDAQPPVELDRSTADRYLRRVAKLDAAYAADKEVAEAEIERVRAWLAARYETYSSQRGYLCGVLERFHQALLTIDPRVKTVKLPAGELRMRIQQPGWTFDVEQFLPWAVEHAPDLVRTVPASQAVDAKAAKAALVSPPFIAGETEGPALLDGEIVPGVTVTNTPPKFSVEITDEQDEVHDDTRARAEEAADQASAMADARDYALDQPERDADDHAAAMADARDYIESVSGDPF